MGLVRLWWWLMVVMSFFGLWLGYTVGVRCEEILLLFSHLGTKKTPENVFRPICRKVTKHLKNKHISRNGFQLKIFPSKTHLHPNKRTLGLFLQNMGYQI
jgi:hypothetical protein